MTNIYLMRDGYSGFYKIGKSNSPAYREKTLLSQAPLIGLHSYWPNQPDSMETELHRIYAAKRRRGEWFDLCDVDIESIFHFFGDDDRVDMAPIPEQLRAWDEVIRYRRNMKVRELELQAAKPTKEDWQNLIDVLQATLESRQANARRSPAIDRYTTS